MIDCPCGYGKDLSAEQKTCPVCGTDVTPLHRLRALPVRFCAEGRALAEQGEVDRAIRKLIVSLALDETCVESHKALADLYVRRGSYGEAIHLYDRALELGGEDEDIVHAKATAEKALVGNKAEAEEASSVAPLSRHLKVALVSFVAGVFAASLYYGFLVKPSSTSTEAAAASSISTPSTNRKDGASQRHPRLMDVPLIITPGENSSDLIPEATHDRHGNAPSERPPRSIAGTVDVQSDSAETLSALPGGSGLTYIVRPGDSLSLVAKRFYGDGRNWSIIFHANEKSLKNPHALQVGTVLLIPAHTDGR